MKRGYYLITIQRPGSVAENIWYEGNLTTFLIIEKEMGRDTVILFSLKIEETEYDYGCRESNR